MIKRRQINNNNNNNTHTKLARRPLHVLCAGVFGGDGGGGVNVRFKGAKGGSCGCLFSERRQKKQPLQAVSVGRMRVAKKGKDVHACSSVWLVLAADKGH